jgi:hypothetical protein
LIFIVFILGDSVLVLLQLEDSIRAKDERYQAIKDGEKALKRMTESITEVISKTKMELTVS